MCRATSGRWTTQTAPTDQSPDRRRGRASAPIDPTGGKALPWNPGKTRGIGGKDLLMTSAGLWVASDGARIGGELHDNIALMPR